MKYIWTYKSGDDTIFIDLKEVYAMSIGTKEVVLFVTSGSKANIDISHMDASIKQQYCTDIFNAWKGTIDEK